jgi:hypothetical protein
MINKYNNQLPDESLQSYCEQYLVNRIYKLLPLKEQELDWQQYLYNLNFELLGAEEIYLRNTHFLSLVHKLESLFLLDSHEEYRRMIFECISVAKSIPIKMIVKEEL